MNKMKIKDIVGILSEVSDVSTGFITSPDSDKMMEVCWQIMSSVAGESLLLEKSAGVDNKRLFLAKQMHSLMERLGLPAEQEFTLYDFLRPNKPRIIAIFSILAPFVRQFQNNLHKRELVWKEKEKCAAEEARTYEQMVKTVEQTVEAQNELDELRKTQEELEEKFYQQKMVIKQKKQDCHELDQKKKQPKEQKIQNSTAKADLERDIALYNSKIEFYKSQLDIEEQSDKLKEEIGQLKENIETQAVSEDDVLDRLKTEHECKSRSAKTKQHCESIEKAEKYLRQKDNLKEEVCALTRNISSTQERFYEVERTQLKVELQRKKKLEQLNKSVENVRERMKTFLLER